MQKFEFCKPVAKPTVPTGADWIHEVKYDGYRGRIVRDGRTAKPFSRAGLDWSWRFPWIVETAVKIRQQRFVIDGEICVLDVQGISDFNALHSNKHSAGDGSVLTPENKKPRRGGGGARGSSFAGPRAGRWRA